MESNLAETRRDSVLSDVLADSAPGEAVYVVGPTAATVRDVVATLHGAATAPTVRLLGDARRFRDVFDEFGVAGTAADLVDADVLSLRTTGETPDSDIVVTADSVVALVHADDRTGGARAEEAAFVADVRAACEEAWAGADPFSLRTPPLSRVRETLAADLGTGVRADFAAAVSALDGGDVDVVAASLLVAAKHEELFYDVSTWGESVGVASKATYSRVKNDLEDAGLIETEKVPVEVGRPRQRLTLADDRLADADATRLVDAARTALA